jgi:hypothetical protein
MPAAESDVRFYRRRANEEMAAAERAVTPEARDRRMRLAGLFLGRLKELESRSAFDWIEEPTERV